MNSSLKVYGLFILAFVSWYSWSLTSRGLQRPLFRNVFLFVCETVHQKFYVESPELQNWYRECRALAEEASYEKTISSLLGRIQLHLNQMGVSHLEVWDPDSNRRLWLSEGLDTGLRARLIGEKFVITELVEGGPALEAGLQLGDILISRDGQAVQDLWGARSRSGRYQIQRGNVQFEVTLVARALRIDESPTLIPVTETAAVLKIPSFVADFFDNWESLASEARSYRELVVDLRGNSGGDFSAMLRGLSAFFCRPTWVGSLEQPRLSQGIETLWPDDLDPTIQLNLLKTARLVRLNTFEGYPCYRGNVTVLVDERTGSTAEIFAEAFRLRSHSRIWGQFTSGQVVLSVWYTLPLGTGYSVNVPQADYVSAQGVRLEGHGVWPEKNLQYDLDLALQGQDSWIVESLRL